MSEIAPIFSYQENGILLHVLFENHPRAKKKMEEVISIFEQTDFNQPLNGKKAEGKLIDLFLDDKEKEFRPLQVFYHGVGFGLPGYPLEENVVLEAGVFYTIAKLLLINYYNRKGLNKLRYASSLPKLPDKFMLRNFKV